LYSAVREAPRSFAIDVIMFSGCASKARALVGALHDHFPDELRERGEDVEPQAAARETGVSSASYHG
jgi:hypothetical protein